MTKIIFRLKGGQGSGYRGHSGGRGGKGNPGGSTPQGEPASRMTGVRLPSLDAGKPDEIRSIANSADMTSEFNRLHDKTSYRDLLDMAGIGRGAQARTRRDIIREMFNKKYGEGATSKFMEADLQDRMKRNADEAKLIEAGRPKPIAGIKSGSDFQEAYPVLFKLESEVETVQGNGERYYNPSPKLRKLAGFALDHFDDVKYAGWESPEQVKNLLNRIAGWEPSQDDITMTSGDAYTLTGTLYKIISKVYDNKDIGINDSPRWYL